MINNPIIQTIYEQTLNKKDKFDAGFLARLETVKSNLEISFKNNDKPAIVKVTNELLLKSINFPNETTISEKLSIINQYIKAVEISEFTAKMGSVTGLTKGLGQSLADVSEKSRNIQDLFAVDAPMNLAEVYQGKTWQNTYLKIFKQFKEDLLPTVFLTANETVQTDFITKVTDAMSSDSRIMTDQVIANIETDVLSYLTIKAYQKNKDRQSQKLSTLGNNLIYPSNEQSIVDVVNRLRQTEIGKDNLFLNDFLISLESNAVGNNTGLFLANANTFRRVTPSQKTDIQNDFAKLFDNLDTKIDAMSIINYMMVKDGLQVRYQSLTDSVSPYILSEYLEQINSVELAFKGEVSYESVFDMSLTELTDEFFNGYLESNINMRYLKKITVDESQGQGLPKKVSRSIKNNTLTITETARNNKGIFVSKVEYIPLEIISQMGFKTTFMYKKESESIVNNAQVTIYNLIETKGSNQQTAVGFMFDGGQGGFQRPTYTEYLLLKDILQTYLENPVHSYICMSGLVYGSKWDGGL